MTDVVMHFLAELPQNGVNNAKIGFQKKVNNTDKMDEIPSGQLNQVEVLR